MARPTRDLITSDRFHFINHGVDGQDLFAIDDDWHVFETILSDVCERYGFKVNAYALMSNHYHLLGDLSECERRPGVADAFGQLQSGYAKYFNRRTQRRGPLFRPRFLSFAVPASHAFRVARYIHLNPIDIAGPRALAAYRWSSLPIYLGRRPTPVWVKDEPLTSMIDPSTHLADLTDCRMEDLWPLDGLVPRAHRTLDTIEESLLSTAGAPTDSHSLRIQRRIAMMLGLDLRAADILTIATHFDCSPKYVRREAHRGRTQCVDDPEFAALSESAQLALTRCA